MDVVARVPLEPRRSLYVVEVAGKTLLVGTSEMGLSVLTELDRARGRGARASSQPSFGEVVRDGMRGGAGRRRRPDDAGGGRGRPTGVSRDPPRGER